jgi:hypothetical protein
MLGGKAQPREYPPMDSAILKWAFNKLTANQKDKA